MITQKITNLVAEMTEAPLAVDIEIKTTERAQKMLQTNKNTTIGTEKIDQGAHRSVAIVLSKRKPTNLGKRCILTSRSSLAMLRTTVFSGMASNGSTSKTTFKQVPYNPLMTNHILIYNRQME